MIYIRKRKTPNIIVSCFFFIAFYGTIRAVKKEQKTYGW